MYRAWAFGASVSGGAVSHCYPLNGNFADPAVRGIGGIVTAYHGMLQNSRLFGPTNFAPVIRATLEIVRQWPRPTPSYACLLIITDGAITDIQETIACAAAASLQLMLHTTMCMPASMSGAQHAMDERSTLCGKAASGARMQGSGRRVARAHVAHHCRRRQRELQQHGAA